MAYFNSVFYDNFQTQSLAKQQEFSSIIIDVNDQRNYSVSDWQKVLDNISSWTDSNIYIIDFYLDDELGDAQNFTSNPKLNFVQSTILTDDFSLNATSLPPGLDSNKIFSLNFPNFSLGKIKDYLPVDGLHPDIIRALYQVNNKEINQPLNINYMIGEGYLPALNFSDVLSGKTDQRLFDGRTVLIVNQQNMVLPTLLSYKKPVNNTQYYGYLFETALQNIEITIVSGVLLLFLMLVVAILAFLVTYYLPRKLRFPLLVGLVVSWGFISFLMLSYYQVYLPVFELMAAIILVNVLIARQNRLNEQEQLITGNRLFNQLLDSGSLKTKPSSNFEQLESFSLFLCELLELPAIAFVLERVNKKHILLFQDAKLHRLDESNVPSRNEFKHTFSLSLLGGVKARLRFPIDKTDNKTGTLTKLLNSKLPYLKQILNDLAVDLDISKVNFLKRLLPKIQVQHVHDKFKHSADSFISHYYLLKNNFENLNTASVLFGINGQIIQTNFAAENFIRENDIKLFNERLIGVLMILTELDEKIIRENLLELVEDQKSIIVLPTRNNGFNKNYLVSLSIYTNENQRFGGFLVELLDIEEVSYIANLKNNYISELNNTLRNDFSEVILAIDFLNMGIEGGPTLLELSAKLEKFADKLHSSEMMLKTTNEIMRNKFYPADIRELVAQGVKAISEEVDEKQISLKVKQPRFINLVLVNYQHFARILRQLMLLAVQDCMEEGELCININELETKGERFVKIEILSKGYGIFDKQTLSGNANSHQVELDEFTKVRDYISSIGGSVEVVSSVGEGSSITTILPCFRM